MAALSYLIKNRIVHPFGSHAFFKAWAKRLLSLPELFQRNTRRLKLVNKGALINKTSEIGELRFEGNKNLLTIGAFSFIGKVYMAGHTSITIGNKVCLNDGVIILTASHDVLDPAWQHVKAAVVIEDYAWIGTNAMILPGVHIGHGAVVGAAAVVTKSVAAGDIVAGNPAVVLSKKRAQDLNYNPCEFLAANRAWLNG